MIARTGVQTRTRKSLLYPLALSLAVGMASALVCIAFRLVLRGLQWIFTGQGGLLADAAAHLSFGRRILIPVAGASLATLVTAWSRRHVAKNGASDYVEAVRFENGRLAFVGTAWRSIASALSIASGAAIGREGSMIQFAASCISSLRQRADATDLSLCDAVCCAVTGAVSSVYNAPIAGVFFGLEIVLGLRPFGRKAWTYVPRLVAAAAGAAGINWLLADQKALFVPAQSFSFQRADIFGVLATSAIIGLLGPIYLYLMKAGKILKSLPFPMIWSALLVGILSCAQPDTWGNGDSGVFKVLAGNVPIAVIAIILLARLLATSACTGSGVVGGVFTPTVFSGAAIGLFCGYGMGLLITNSSPQTSYALIGIACLLAAVTHAPFMAMFMAAELTGALDWLWVLAPACFLSLVISKRLSAQSFYAVATQDPVKTAPPKQLGPVSSKLPAEV
jgi:chloride channel protein, CIC family